MNQRTLIVLVLLAAVVALLTFGFLSRHAEVNREAAEEVGNG